jgi:hypothetical protein
MDAQEPDDLVVVTVVRTGGFAGLRRRWVAQPPPAQASHWVALIDGCPWDDDIVPDDGDPGADRFVWRIDARSGRDERQAELPETRLNGPWRQLVDEVQSFEDARDDSA